VQRRRASLCSDQALKVYFKKQRLIKTSRWEDYPGQSITATTLSIALDHKLQLYTDKNRPPARCPKAGGYNWIDFPGDRDHITSRAFLRRIPETERSWFWVEEEEEEEGEEKE